MKATKVDNLTTEDKFFYNVDWKGKRTTFYTSKAASDKAQRHLIARGLICVRQHRRKQSELIVAREEKRQQDREQSIVYRLMDSRVVDIELSRCNSRLDLTDGCDYYYTEHLTKQEAQRLVNELQSLVDKMADDS